jgi:hypothetical protein
MSIRMATAAADLLVCGVVEIMMRSARAVPADVAMVTFKKNAFSWPYFDN